MTGREHALYRATRERGVEINVRTKEASVWLVSLVRCMDNYYPNVIGKTMK